MPHDVQRAPRALRLQRPRKDGPRTVRTRHPLRTNPRFRRLFLARSLSLAGDALIPAALALAVFRLTGSTTTLALILGCAMAPRLLLLPLGGVVGDRLDARTVALTTDAVRCLTQLVVAIQFLGGNADLRVLAGAEFVAGAASAFAMPVLPHLITSTTSAAERTAANASLGVSRNVASVLGPALAGVLVLTVGPGWAFALDSLTFGTSALLLAGLRLPRIRLPRRSLRADLAAGHHEVLRHRWYATSLVAHAVWNGAAASLATLGPALAITELGGEEAWLAIVQTGAVGLLAGSLLASRARPRRPVLVGNLALASYALPLALFAAAAPLWAICAAYGVALTALGFLNPTWETVVQSTFPPSVLARVTSYDWLLSLGAMPVGYALAPLAADAWGTAPFLALLAVLVGVSCAGTALVPEVRRFGAADGHERPAAPPPPAGEAQEAQGLEKSRGVQEVIRAPGTTDPSSPAPAPAAPPGELP